MSSANTSQIQLSSLDFDSIKRNLVTYLSSQNQFKDYNFEGSGLNILLDLLSYNTFYNAFYMNMIANEMFLDTAVLRSSVVSQAKSFGYTPRSAVASQASLNVSIIKSDSDTTTSLHIPKYTQFSSQSTGGTTYSFYTTDDTEYVANSGNTFIFSYVPVKEGNLVTKQYIVDNSTNPTQSFDLTDQNIDMSTLYVTVQNSITNPTYNVYTLAQDATQVYANTNVYYTEEGTNANYIIYFGDGVLGSKLPDQSIITVSYLVTDADVANGLSTFFLNSLLLNGSTSNVTTVYSSSGGAPQETVDSIKYTAPKSFIAQNRIVTKNDYITQINKKYPYFDAVAVWGGDQQNPPVYGKVFVSAKPKNGYVVTQDQQNYLIQDVLKPLSVLTVTAEYVAADYDFLNFNLSVKYDPNNTTTSQQQLQSFIANVVSQFTNTTLNTFNSTFKYSKFLSAIDGTDNSIQSSEATIYLQKKFSPLLNQTQSYTLNFGTPLHQGITNDRLYSSPYFLGYDASGNQQQCYIEETPFSYGTISSVTIESPGYNYTSAPTLMIEGDGVGANAYPVIVNGAISSVIIDKPGSGYTTAAIMVTGGGGRGATLFPIISGSYGKLRTYYFDYNNVKQIINPNAGTINYLNGTVTITNLNPILIGGNQAILSIYAQPADYNFSSNNEIILTYDQNDPTALSITTKVVSS
jgi:hypothetical protein